MNCLKDSVKILQICKQQSPLKNKVFKRYKNVSPCETKCFDAAKKECFDINKLVIMRADNTHAKIIKSFLYSHYWPREPSVTSVWMDVHYSSYLAHKTESYATSGDRLLALEKIGKHVEGKLVGLAVSNKIYPWAIDELDEWAHHTESRAEQNRMYLCAHFLRSPNLFKKYNVDYIYEVEVLATAAEVTGHGVGTALLKVALENAQDLRHPLVQVIAVSHYTALICEKLGLKKDWEMKYKDFVDRNGSQVLFPRSPHLSVAIYTRYMDPTILPSFSCKPPIF